MAYNKVIKKDGTILLDLTNNTVAAETLGKGVTATDRSGNKITGTLTDSPLPIEISTEEEMVVLLESGEVGSIYKYVGTTGTYENNALYVLEEIEESDPLQGTWVWNDTLDNNPASLSGREFSVYLNFTCNNNSLSFNRIVITFIGQSPFIVRMNYILMNNDDVENSVVSYAEQWTDSIYKEITINSIYDELISLNDATKATNFLSWLQTNATKQPSKTFAKLVIPTGTLDITTNAVYDVTEYANVDVNVEDSPLPIEISTEEEMITLLESGEVGSVYKYMGESTEVYENGAMYVLEDDTLAGRWFLNDTLTTPSEELTFVVDGTCMAFTDTNSTEPTREVPITSIQFTPNVDNMYGVFRINTVYGTYNMYYYNSTYVGGVTINGTIKTISKTSAIGIQCRMLMISSKLKDVANGDVLLTWLQENAKTDSAKSFTKLILQSDLEEITITENGEYSGEYSKVTVDVESGGSAEFNIAYGDTEPTDTSKLWVKASEPSEVQVTTKPVYAVDDFQMGIASLPTGASSIGVASVGTKIYLFGGGGFLNTINVFDTENNTITTLDTTLPTGATNIGAVSVGTKIYLFGGYVYASGNVYLNTINVFDTETNTITTLTTTLPTGANYIGVASVGTKIYLFGGGRGSSYLNTINVFNTETNTITTLDVTLPTSAYSIGVASVGTKIYLFGGNRGSYLNTINVFDTETNTITTLDTTLPTSAYAIGVASVGTKIYLFGGRGGSIYLNTINVFNTETNTITTLDTTLPTSAYNIGVASVGTKIYLFGGYNDNSLDTINAFILGLSLPTNNMLLEATLLENTFNLLPNVEIGVKNVYIGNENDRAELVSVALYKNGAWTNI